MPFDGFNYSGAAFIYPVSYHPKAVLSGPVYGLSLRNAYAQARQHARIIFQQTYGLNDLSPGDLFDAGYLFKSTSMVNVAGGHAYIGHSDAGGKGVGTFAVCKIAFSVFSNTGTTLSARLLVTDGTTTATGTTVTQTTAAPNYDAVARHPTTQSQASASALAQLQAANLSYLIEAEVDLAAINLNTICTATAQAYTVKENDATVGVSTKIHHVSCWWEVRD